MTIANIVGDICGFLVVIIAIVLLNAFKDMEVSLDDLSMQMRPKRKVVRLSSVLARDMSSVDDALLTRNLSYGTSSDSDRNV